MGVIANTINNLPDHLIDIDHISCSTIFASKTNNDHII